MSSWLRHNVALVDNRVVKYGAQILVTQLILIIDMGESSFKSFAEFFAANMIPIMYWYPWRFKNFLIPSVQRVNVTTSRRFLISLNGDILSRGFTFFREEIIFNNILFPIKISNAKCLVIKHNVLDCEVVQTSWPVWITIKVFYHCLFESKSVFWFVLLVKLFNLTDFFLGEEVRSIFLFIKLG